MTDLRVGDTPLTNDYLAALWQSESLFLLYAACRACSVLRFKATLLMLLRVAIQMDPLESIDARDDDTLWMAKEAQNRGYELHYYTPDKLTWNNGRITAEARPLTLPGDSPPAPFYVLGEVRTLDLATMDVVLLRQDPPVDMAYITTTYILEKLHPKPLIINNPKAVRDLPEKIFPTLLRQFMPPTLITASVDEIGRFLKIHKDIVVKPLYYYGGKRVFRIRADDSNFKTLLELMFAQGGEPLVVQPFLAEVMRGDLRVVLIDGQVAGVMRRLPAEGEFRVNLKAGGRFEQAELTPRAREICSKLAPYLRDNGLVYSAVDIIGDYIIEVNITSPGCGVDLEKLYNHRLDSTIWDAIERRLGI